MARVLLNHHRRQPGPRLSRAVVATLVATAMTLLAAPPGQASGVQPPPQVIGVDSLGACTLSGTVTFSPSLTAVPKNTSVTIIVGGSCLGLITSPHVDANYGAGSILMSCEAGAGTVTAAEMFSTGAPPAPSGTGFLVAGPGTIEITIVSGAFIGVVTLVWANPVATAICPVAGSGTNPIPVTGAMVFQYGA